MKRRVSDLKALAGFEKSGHFFFNAPIGRGYDDGIVTAIHIVDMLDRNPGKSMAELYAQLPQTWGSPTMSPHCDDETKYGVAEKVTERLKAMQAKGELARKLSQLQDNLASFALALSSDQLKTLDESSRIELGFPHDFYAKERVRSLVYGGLRDQILA